MVRGLSFQKGIIFIGKQHIACAYDEEGISKDWILPLNPRSLLQVVIQVVKAMPLWFKLLTTVYFSLIIIPKLLSLFQVQLAWTGFPFYFIFYYMFGTHFFFPKSLRKYHGAEHKVFSYDGIISIINLANIQKAEITNRYCSTNLVVVFFSTVFLLSWILLLYYPFTTAIQLASYGSLLLAPLINFNLYRKRMKWLKSYVLKVSYFLQRHVTTTNPDDLHIKTAIRSYRRLALREFPGKLKQKPIRKDVLKLAIVDITIIPIGTNQPSVSQYVAEIHQLLETYKDKVNYQLTPMSTLIEGELPVLFEIIQALHEVPFSNGVNRVATNIRIDDRRDKQLTLIGKLQSVEDKLKQMKGNK